MKQKKIYIRPCRICKQNFESQTTNKLTCSPECEKTRIAIYLEHYRKTPEFKIAQTINQAKLAYNKYETWRLWKKRAYLQVRIQVVDKLLQQRGEQF